MKLAVKYFYSQKFLPTKRHKNTRKREIEDVFSVNIPELIADVFPVAFLIHDMQSVQEGMTSYEDYDNEKSDFRMFTEEIRTYKRKLYMPVRFTHGAAISTVFADEKYVIAELERIARKKWYGADGAQFSDKSVVVEDNQTEICRILRKMANEYIYFNRTFWRVCNEPLYVVNTFGFGNNHGGTGFFIEFRRNPSIPSENYFNALQRDAAIAYGKSVAIGRGDTKFVDSLGEYSNIEVIMPEMVKARPNKRHENGK